jgi:hypothetical protein
MTFLPVRLLVYAVESDNVLKAGSRRRQRDCRSVLRQNNGIGNPSTKIIGNLAEFRSGFLFFS